MNTETQTTIAYLGVDVSKAHLDLAGAPATHPRRIPNAPKSIATLLAALPAGTHVLVEATGGYERALVAACHQAQRPVSVLNPLHVRRFAQARGRLAKTDAIDAALLADFGSALRPAPTPPSDPLVRQLAELVDARDQIVTARTATVNALEHATHKTVVRLHRNQLRRHEAAIKVLEAAIKALLTSHEPSDLGARADILQKAPGVGLIVAATLLAHLPELGAPGVNRQQIAALAGLAPFNSDSGQRQGHRSIKGGRPKVRRALYLASVALLRAKDSPLRSVHSHLRDNGKPPKVALVAVARKLLIHLNSSLKSPSPSSL